MSLHKLARRRGVREVKLDLGAPADAVDKLLLALQGDQRAPVSVVEPDAEHRHLRRELLVGSVEEKVLLLVRRELLAAAAGDERGGDGVVGLFVGKAELDLDLHARGGGRVGGADLFLSSFHAHGGLDGNVATTRSGGRKKKEAAARS